MPFMLIDKHYLIKWDKNDLNAIFSLCKDIREGRESVKTWDDIIEHNGFVKPLKVCTDEKYIATYKGVASFCKLITGESTNRPACVAVGTGTSTPHAFNYALDSEQEYVMTATNGFVNASGTSIRYCGTFGSSVASNDFKESLLRDQASVSGSTVYCRNTFVTNFIDHDEGAAGFSAAGIFEFVPVQD